MKEFTIQEKVMAFPIGTLLGLTARQASKRAHLLEKVDKGETGERCLYRVKNREAKFKVGEKILLDSSAVQEKGGKIIPKRPAQAPEQESKGTGPQDTGEGKETGKSAAQEPKKEDPPKDLDEMLKGMDEKQLKAALDNRKVKYHHKAGEDKLRGILKPIIKKELAKAAK